MEYKLKLKGKARVQVLLEVELNDIWGGDCPIEQLHKQAKESAYHRIDKMIVNNPDIKVIGKPKVIGIITEVKD